MPDRHSRSTEVVSPSAPRRLLGSEVIRKRVDQLLHSTSGETSQHQVSPGLQVSNPRTTHRALLADSHPKPQGEAYERKRQPAHFTAELPSLDKPGKALISSTMLTLASPHARLHRPSASVQYTLSSESEQRKEHLTVAKRLPKDTPDNNIGRECSGPTQTRPIRSIQPVFTGPLAVAEFARLKQEIETLKDSLHEYKKVSRRDKKRLEECQTELTSTLSKLNENDMELSTLKANHKKVEQLLSTIEHSVQCQICMELPDNPFALSPCGHTLCLPCLQEWFRKAPPALEDSDIDPEELSDPHYILMRSKSCPSCRSRVRRRPVPIFMVKAVAAALKNAKSTDSDISGATRIVEDPWTGIFPSSDEEDSDDQDDSETDSDEENAVLLGWYDDDDDGWPGSESDDERDVPQHEYVPAQWEPPRDIRQASWQPVRDMHMSEETLQLLQRGCTLEMTRAYTLTYERDRGVALILSGRPLDFPDSSDEDEDSDGEGDIDRLHYIYLGWNITLAPEDLDGTHFVDQTLRDIRDNPRQWDITQRSGPLRGIDATRLVSRHAIIDNASDDDTDVETWADADDGF